MAVFWLLPGGSRDEAQDPILISKHVVLSDLHSSGILGCYTALVGSYRRFCTACRSKLIDCSIIEDGTDRFFQNVGK
jgi:hypothetical protein